MVYCVLFISAEGRYGCLANYESHNTFTRSSEHSGEGVFVSYDHNKCFYFSCLMSTVVRDVKATYVHCSAVAHSSI